MKREKNKKFDIKVVKKHIYIHVFIIFMFAVYSNSLFRYYAGMSNDVKRENTRK